VASSDYVAEKCHQAVDALEKIKGSRRVWQACEYLSRLDGDMFPDEEGRGRWGAIMEMIDRHEAEGEEGRWAATLEQLSDLQIESIEREIRELCAMYPFGDE
jgi:hypothetical protein